MFNFKNKNHPAEFVNIKKAKSPMVIFNFIPARGNKQSKPHIPYAYI